MFIAYIAGAGIFADYADVRAFVYERFMIEWPEYIPAWFVILPALVWIIAATTHKEVMRQRTSPRLIFGSPHIALFPLTNVQGGQDLVELGSITVRNDPINRLGGIEAKDAFGVVTFYCVDEDFYDLKMRHPRWTQNPKPRPDEVPVGTIPKFKHEMNFRTLLPNNSEHRLDFVIKHLDEIDTYGFEGASQHSEGWKNTSLRLFGRKWVVIIKIEATNLDSLAEYRLVLQNQGKGRSLKIISYKVYEAECWIGIG